MRIANPFLARITSPSLHRMREAHLLNRMRVESAGWYLRSLHIEVIIVLILDVFI